MKRLFLFACAIIAMLAAVAAQPTRPRLVVGLMVDQMRWDYLYYYQDRFAADGGFNRLLTEGFSCNNTIIDYVPTVTACGHASVYTGTTPAFHGIAGNNYFIHGKHVSSVQDDEANGVGTSRSVGKRSPRNLLATTIGDELRLATGFASRVYGVALKDRASVLPAGHSANAAFWFSQKDAAFITSDYYMKQLPQWLTEFNRRNTALLKTDLSRSPKGVSMTFAMAEAILINEKLGQTGNTDMLAISISPTDLISHQHGTRSPQTDSAYVQLDADLGRFLSTLDEKVGRGNYLLFLSADHGGTNNYKYSSAHKIPSGSWKCWSDDAKQVNDLLYRRFGVKNIIKDFNEFSLYLNNSAIDSAALDREVVKAEAKRVLYTQPAVELVVDLENIHRETVPEPLKQRLIKGYHHERSGELFVLLKPGYYAGDITEDGSNHGTWTTDDAHIPLVFMGWGINHGETSQPVGMTSIAATVCALLHIQMPSVCIGTPILPITEPALNR